MPKLRIGEVVVKFPIIQGGMGVGISLSGLASAVANQGGIGVIAANSIGMLDPAYYAKHRDANARALREEIRKTREKTTGVFGVNIMVAVNDFHELLEVAIQEKVAMVFLGAGLPIKGIPVEALRSAKVKVVPIVSSSRAARLIFTSWEKRYGDIPDAVVVEGPKAGGHLGFKEEQINDPAFALEAVLPQVVAEIKVFEKASGRRIPVIAAGGIFTGADIHRAFKLGASGVQMGTRFVATHECDADIRFKESYVSCRKEDICIIKSPVGMPGRAIGNAFLRDVASGKKRNLKCAWRCLKSCDTKTAPYCISLALDNARRGLLDQGFVFAGSNAFRIDKIVFVKELIQELKKGYLAAEEREAGTLKTEYEKALERLVSLKEEYLLALKTSYGLLKEEYERGIEKRAETLWEEYSRMINEISSLKIEYSEVVDRANRLKDELITLFEGHSFFKTAQPESA
ncbi:MAG: nitronate monooxygenase [Deltaproteobacteria bacterium]|nr:nitronate monooxygenase [Deltaproteobacteria bacterium]